MFKSKILLCIGVFAVSLIACQKETSEENGLAAPAPGVDNNGGGTTNGTEQASWNFVSAQLISTMTMEGTYVGLSFKSIGTTNITSTDNQGTVEFTGNAMDVKDVGFNLDGMTNTDIYSNGIKAFSASAPFSESVPPTSELAAYNKIGTDSLYFPNGLSVAGQIGPIGAKLKWDGNKMTLTIPSKESFSDDYNGTPMSATLNNTLIITLQKP